MFLFVFGPAKTALHIQKLPYNADPDIDLDHKQKAPLNGGAFLIFSSEKTYAVFLPLCGAQSFLLVR